MSNSKYRNVKTEVDGVIFDSKREAARYVELKMSLRSKIITNLELQKRYDLRVNGVKICTYVADFAYLDKDGREVVEDVKGVRDLESGIRDRESGVARLDFSGYPIDKVSGQRDSTTAFTAG